MEQDISSYQPEMISYDKVDPLPTEKPFFIKDDSKINRIILKKEKKFPWIHMCIFVVVIPIVAFLMGIFYIGGLWNPIEKLPDLNYLIINDDAGCVGQQCTGALASLKLGANFENLNQQGIGHFDVKEGTLEDAIDNIEKHNYWIALYIPKNFTTTMLANIMLPNKTEVVIERIYDQARSYSTISFAKKVFNKLQDSLNINLITNLEKNFSSMQKTFNPLFKIDGITYNDRNLHPIDVYGQYYATFISFVLIWIGTIAVSLMTHFIFPLEGHWIEKKDATHAIIKTMCTKTVATFSILFAICFIISIIPMCCGTVTMQKGYGAVLFFFFFFSFCGIGVNNLLIHVFHFINFYLIACSFLFLQLISCCGTMHHDLQFKFFSIGKLFPMYYATREIKYIYFGSGKHTQTSNILILLCWAVGALCVSYSLYYLELKAKRENYKTKNANEIKN